MNGRLDAALRTLLSQQAAISTDLSALRADTAKAITHLEVIDQRNKVADQDHVDFEVRLRALEQFKYKLLGMALLTGGLSGYIGYLLGHLH